MRRSRIVLPGVLVWATAVSTAGAAEPAGVRVAGLAMPRRSVHLGVVPEGRVAHVHIEEHQFVSAGTALISLDDTVQRVRAATARARAASTADVELARVRLEQATGEWERLGRLGTDGFATPKELEDARRAVELAELGLAVANRDQRLAELNHERERAILAEYQVVAPFDGYVARLHKHVGDTVGERETVVEFVELRTLEVIVDCPIALAARIVPGQPVIVQPVDLAWPVRRGTVLSAARAADPASQTLRVRVVVDNRDHAWIGGLRVEVDFHHDEALSSATALHGVSPAAPGR